MAAYELTTCPRCRQGFECKPNAITECQCFGLRFTDAEKTYIESAASDCLCRSCLMTLQQEANALDSGAVPQDIEAMFPEQ